MHRRAHKDLATWNPAELRGRSLDVRVSRRTLLGTLAAALALPRSRLAQAAGGPARIGFIPLGSPASADDQALVDAFRQGLRAAGLVEDRDVAVEIAWIAREPETYDIVDSLIDRGVRLLVPCGSYASSAAFRQTKTIPIVFVSVGNPVGIGLVRTLAHPGRNATGFSDMLAELSGKYVELARETGRPNAPVDYVWHTLWPDGQYRYQSTERAARALGVKLRSRGLGDVNEVNYVMAAVKGDGGSFMIVQPSPFTFRERHRLIEAATHHGLGTIYAFPAAARDGAMVAFGPDYEHMYRRVGAYVARILAGAKPADLPVQQPTKFDLIVNLKVARSLGLTMPPALVQRADQVIE
jgi:putative tryptophan/tyrosine transport system substrate-binding protein